MTTPLYEPLLTVPYVGIAEFQASPTWLDLQNLVQGSQLQAAQNAELYNQLLKASAWADGYVKQPLKAHFVVEDTTARVDKRGRIWLHPHNNPVRSITGFAYGTDLSNMQTLTTNLNTQVWVSDQRGIVVALASSSATFLGSLQFGSPPASGYELYVQYEYIAGYGNAVLTSAVAANATNLQVDDPTGFQPPSTSLLGTSYGASIARIWDPGVEEAVTVASNYVAGNNPLVTSATTNAHLAGAQVSEFPAEVRQAVIQYACSLLLREDVEEDLPFSGQPGTTAQRRSEKHAVRGGLVNDAECALHRYQRTR